MNNLLSGLAEYVEEEKTAGFLNDLMKKTGPIQQTMPRRKQVIPMQDALRKAKFDAYEKMLHTKK